MNVGVYFCRCGGIVSGTIDGDAVAERLLAAGAARWVEPVDLGCGEDGLRFIESDLAAKRPDAVVFAACSPREHEATFRGAMTRAGLNPFMMQLVNVREHIAWVTEDPVAATDKAFRQIKAACARVRAQQPLEVREIDVDTGALVVGAGPAGLKAALTLAEAGRHVVLVEKSPILGGQPMRYEDVFPRMECGPCVLEPFVAEVLHGPHAEHIELHLMSEVVDLVGSFGSFTLKIRKRPRFVDVDACIGCGECIPVCPMTYPNPAACGLGPRHAMDFEFFGGLPNAPFIDQAACLRSRGSDCDLCRAACPIDGAVVLDQREEVVERTAGALVLAVGADLFDCRTLPHLGYGSVAGVVTSLELERLFSSNGPTNGVVARPDGEPPRSVAIVHCVGSLDPAHSDYCSGVCCLDAFKFNTLFAHKLPITRVTHFVRSVVAPGKDEAELVRHALERPATRIVSYRHLDDLLVTPDVEGIAVRHAAAGGSTTESFDLVVLMPAVVPSASARALARLADVATDRHGFMEELHGRVDATRSKVRGIMIAGTCQAPKDIERAMTQGAAAAGLVLSALVPGRKLALEAVHADVDGNQCSGCRSCGAVCPYKAIAFESAGTAAVRAAVNPVLCAGCGTCVAACPSGAISGRHFTADQIFAEIEGALR